MEKQVVIIGGGLSGLAAAEILAGKKFKVLVLEKEPVLGGLAGSFPQNGEWLPKSYHHIMRPDKTTLECLARLGLKRELSWVNSAQAVWYQGQQYLLSKPRHLLKFKPLTLADKLRLLYFGAYCYLPHDWRKLDRERCDRWLEGKLGKHATDLLFRNLLEMKFNLPLAEAGTAWLGRRLHQSLHSGDWYAYPRAGINEMIERLKQAIIKNNGAVVTDFEVDRIAADGVSGTDLKSGEPRVYPASIVISSLPPPLLARLYPFSREQLEQLRKVKYKAMVSFVFGSDKKYTDHYWNIVLSPRLSFGGVFNHSVFRRGPEHVYYLFSYADGDSEFFNLGDAELQARYLADLKKLWPDLTVKWGKIFKFRHSQPIFTKGYVNPPLRTGTGNLFLTGVYRGYPAPRTMDSALRQGRLTAAEVLRS